MHIIHAGQQRQRLRLLRHHRAPSSAIDGVNERGLAFGALNFPASAHYLDVADQDQSRSIGSFADGRKAAAAADEIVLRPLPSMDDIPEL